MARELQFVARDFLGLGRIGDVKEKGERKDSGMPLKLHEVDSSHSSGASASINSGILINSMAFAGLKHPFRSNAAPFQHHLPSKNLVEEELTEQSGESAPERSYPPRAHPMQVVGGFGGLPKNALTSPTPNLHRHAGFLEAVELRMPASEPTEKKYCAPLTIFYRGNVNVFNEITAEKAQAILFLASNGNLQGLASAGVLNSSAMNSAMVSPGVLNISAVNLAMPSPSAPNISAVNLASRIQMDQPNCNNVDNSQSPADHAGFGSANMQLDLGHLSAPASSDQDQPIVPTALPQARKASLARFLERRRERVHSKLPYPLKQADSLLPEERFSSSNDIAPCTPYISTEEKKKVSLPSWMVA